MKKFLALVILMCAFVCCASAQWTSSYQQGSDSTVGYTVYTYVCDDGSLVLNDKDECEFEITTSHGVFNYYSEGSDYGLVKISAVGLYDECMLPIETLRDFSAVLVPGKGRTAMGRVGYRMINKKFADSHSRMHNFALYGTGYIRMIVEKYNDAPLDIMIPTMPLDKKQK